MDNPQIVSPGWMLKQDNMALINQCRKYIQMEFGTRLLFSQPDLIERIRESSHHSQNRKLKELIRELEQRLGTSDPETAASPTAASKRRYRGQAVNIDIDSGNIPTTESPRSLRIYRGQVLTD